MSRWRTKEVEELVVVGKADLGWWWVKRIWGGGGFS
jgi:hypothetical protein